ncbi:hypothetical protein J2736_006667 [Paenibacillus qinlingensis]|uniref:Uncharacterized protein n=1 Tax=Paenibacillus qinlingensis TaxID=1837343 RepID=A0ABU1P6M9_9BACL|nr:hypothetical protein [Paenibacillus qinlingensis]
MGEEHFGAPFYVGSGGANSSKRRNMTAETSIIARSGEQTRLKGRNDCLRGRYLLAQLLISTILTLRRQ